MVIKKILATLLCGALVLSLTACGSRPGSLAEEEEQKTVTVIDNMDDLEDGKYYIQHGEEYYELYAGAANFETGDATPTAANSGAYTVWYTNDWEAVPTMYAGDKLIYKTSSDFTEKFSFLRFKYLGGTMGICSLSKTSTGRYRYEFDDDGINSASDAGRLEDLSSSSDTIIIEKVGGSALRSGNVSDGGSIIGLTLGEIYDADIYAGTKLNHYKLAADCTALESMDYLSTEDYTFLRSQVVQVNLPSWMNTGYYFAGENNGLFRYVKATSYNDATDFNIANVAGSTNADKSSDTQSSLNSSDGDTKKGSFSVEEEGTYRISVTYGESEDNLGAPACTVTGGTVIYTLDTYQNNLLQKDITLTPGDYTITVSNLFGRTCEFKVTKVES